jgi:hypothetical protein
VAQACPTERIAPHNPAAAARSLILRQLSRRVGELSEETKSQIEGEQVGAVALQEKELLTSKRLRNISQSQAIIITSPSFTAC